MHSTTRFGGIHGLWGIHGFGEYMGLGDYMWGVMRECVDIHLQGGGGM